MSDAALHSPAFDLRQSRWYSFVKWGANLSLLGGGAAMAAAPAFSLSPWAFVPFAVAHVVWTFCAHLMRERELFWLNVGALALDIWAIVARL